MGSLFVRSLALFPVRCSRRDFFFISTHTTEAISLRSLSFSLSPLVLKKEINFEIIVVYCMFLSEYRSEDDDEEEED